MHTEHNVGTETITWEGFPMKATLRICSQVYMCFVCVIGGTRGNHVHVNIMALLPVVVLRGGNFLSCGFTSTCSVTCWRCSFQ